MNIDAECRIVNWPNMAVRRVDWKSRSRRAEPNWPSMAAGRLIGKVHLAMMNSDRWDKASLMMMVFGQTFLITMIQPVLLKDLASGYTLQCSR